MGMRSVIDDAQCYGHAYYSAQAGFRTALATAFTCSELSRGVKDAAFAFRQWLLSGQGSGSLSALASLQVIQVSVSHPGDGRLLCQPFPKLVINRGLQLPLCCRSSGLGYTSIYSKKNRSFAVMHRSRFCKDPRRV